MLFKPELIERILAGDKTQTRRVVKPGEQIVVDATAPDVPVAILDARGRVKWRVGQTYALQPGRGKAGIGVRIRVKRLSLDYDVRNIDIDSAHAEGFRSREEFLTTWMHLNDRGAHMEFNWPGSVSQSLGREWLWYANRRFHCESDGDDAAAYMSSRPAERYRAWVIQFEVVR